MNRFYVTACLCILGCINQGSFSHTNVKKSYDILMLLPVSSRSHRHVFLALAEGLADKGHKVTMLSNSDKPLKYPNITEITHGLPHFPCSNDHMFIVRTSPTTGVKFFSTALPLIAKEIYDIPEVIVLYEKRKSFDLIIVEHMFNEVIYPFLHETSYITIATPGLDYRQAALLGNPSNPAYISGFSSDYERPFSLFSRIHNLVMQIFFYYFWSSFAVAPEIQKLISERFPDLPPLREIERNQSLTLMNSHFSTSTAIPLLPNQVEIGGIHCKPANPLPQKLLSWIEGAGDEGVIYFSLGSVANARSMPTEARNLFVEVFGRLKQRVLWKIETEIQNLPNNVMIDSWLPQQDILGHPNVKLFMTHGGMLSTTEAIYHATPLVALPIFGDQPRNAKMAQDNGFSVTLDWDNLTSSNIENAINEVLYNNKYRTRIQEYSKLLTDQPESPLERAIFWTEYVIRHNGAHQLKSPAASLSWIEFLMLDFIFIIHIFFFLIHYLLKKVSSLVFGRKMPKDLKQKKKKKE